ncbi:MAG TPA: hypothetical protein VF491_15010 [Vicinamibacterales bacterium]|jgi:hypothetical protein
MAPRYLHVANGHATTELLERSAVPGRLMVWADSLYDGPVPGDVSDDELLRVRARYHAATWGDADDIAAGFEASYAAVADEDAFDELVLWFEHDLFDQLNLIQLLTHLRSVRVPRKPVSLISINAYPGHTGFKGLGELQPVDLAQLFEKRAEVADEQLALAQRAWQAYRSVDPRAIEALLDTDTSALPFLAPALRRHLEEFPSAENGLSRSEQRLMEQAVGAPADLHHLFPRMHDGETAYYITDTSLWDRANELATASPPLATVTVIEPRPLALPKGTIALTAAGRDVLAGRADRVRLCGIDRWFGGVRVEGTGPAWRWSSRDGRLIVA